MTWLQPLVSAWRPARHAITGAATYALVNGCSNPSAPPTPQLSVRAMVEPGDNDVPRLRFTARNDGPDVLYLSGCPRAPGYHLDSQIDTWFEVLSVGVVCQANQTTERVPIAPGASISRFVGVAVPGTYRFRILVDGTDGGPVMAVTSNSMVVR